LISWGAVNGPAPQTPVAAAGVNPASAQLRARMERYLVFTLAGCRSRFLSAFFPHQFHECLTGRRDAAGRVSR